MIIFCLILSSSFGFLAGYLIGFDDGEYCAFDEMSGAEWLKAEMKADTDKRKRQ